MHFRVNNVITTTSNNSKIDYCYKLTLLLEHRHLMSNLIRQFKNDLLLKTRFSTKYFLP